MISVHVDPFHVSSGTTPLGCLELLESSHATSTVGYVRQSGFRASRASAGGLVAFGKHNRTLTPLGVRNIGSHSTFGKEVLLNSLSHQFIYPIKCASSSQRHLRSV
jgi:hypothetical protein